MTFGPVVANNLIADQASRQGERQCWANELKEQLRDPERSNRLVNEMARDIQRAEAKQH